MAMDDKQAVALSSVAASAAMATMKLVVGLMTGSLGILSEAAHSLLDLGAAAITYFAVRISDQPADDRHPYGHGKIEAVSALIETGLLFLTGAWIIKEAVERLFSQPRPIETTWYAVAVIVISIFIDIGRSRALMKVAKATGSQALEADALHFTSDILTSAVVLAGLGFVALGWEKGDALAAIAVAVCVAVAGYRLGKRTIDVLMDKAPDGIAEHVETIALAIPGIIRVERVRARPAGAIIFVELSLKVSRTLPLERVEALRAEVAERVRKALPQVEPLVVAEPLALDDETIAERVRVAAACRNLSVHDIGVHAIGATRLVSFDVEVDEALTIKAAHDITTELERAVSAELGGGVVVDTHIDPRRSVVSEATDLDSEVYARLSSTIRGLAEGQEMVHGVHRIQAQRGGEGLYISFHCAFADAAPVRRVHDVTVRLEYLIRQAVSGVARVVIHAEPVLHVDDALPGIPT